MITLNFQPSPDGEHVSLVLSGNTWAFRQRLDALSVSGTYHSTSDEGDSAKTYFRVLRDLAAADPDTKQKMADLLGKACFKGLALRSTVSGEEPVRGTPAAIFLATLRENPQLHWTR